MLPRTLYHLILLLSLFVMRSHAELPIRLITHNIRYATTSPFTGEKPWADRKQLILNELYYNSLHNAEAFICLQEVLHKQLVDVMAGLNKTDEWSFIGVGRDDGKQAGEYSPIIYRPKIWKLENWRTVWLSETPDRPGKGWDAASVRIVTVGTFQHIKSKQRVVSMSTHLDDQGAVSRRESAKLILKVIEQVTRPDASGNSTRLPVLLAGDLNSPPDGDAYKILNAEGSAVQDLEELSDWRYGDKSTFTGFQDKERTKIDHLFAGPRDGGVWKVKGYSVLPNRFEDGVYNSDHRAVVGDLVLVF